MRNKNKKDSNGQIVMKKMNDKRIKDWISFKRINKDKALKIAKKNFYLTTKK